MAINTMNPSEKSKIKAIIDEGIRIKEEVKILQDSLRETVAAIAEELDIPKGTLSKAINVAYKGTFNDENEKITDVEELLVIAGKR